jgi:outer membrane protein assembly factor BamE (lipoprotein component of BamABCDE complex)
MAAIAAAALMAGCASPGANPANQITPEQIARVQRGMTADQVRATLGAPALVDRGRQNQDIWTYKYIDRAQSRPHMELYVYFDGATKTVTRAESGIDKIYDPGGD